MAPDKRTVLFNVRMSPEEDAMLKQLADDDGLTAADVIRQYIRRTYAEKHGSKKPKRTK
ncbi:MAG TPA: hypothetical protein VK550_13505 [Polyangiaceae bacterium]|jgi:predicted DNA-binding protein|nr:hypothetical protein [Polyangiaceae bacterium]